MKSDAAVVRLSRATRTKSLGGTTLTDERVIVVGSVNGGEGEPVGTYSRPRQCYLSLMAKLAVRSDLLKVRPAGPWRGLAGAAPAHDPFWAATALKAPAPIP